MAKIQTRINFQKPVYFLEGGMLIEYDLKRKQFFSLLDLKELKISSWPRPSYWWHWYTCRIGQNNFFQVTHSRNGESRIIEILKGFINIRQTAKRQRYTFRGSPSICNVEKTHALLIQEKYVFRYSITGDVWEEMPELNRVRFFPSCTSLGTNFYVTN